MFWAGPNFLNQSKNLIAFKASSKTFVRAQKPNLLNGNHLLVRHKFFWDCHKIFISIFGLAQNIWTSPKYFGTCRRTRHKYLNGGNVIDTKLCKIENEFNPRPRVQNTLKKRIKRYPKYTPGIPHHLRHLQGAIIKISKSL